MILGLIPSRLNSKRLKEKPLLEIDGLPIIVHTFKRAQLSKKLDDVIVCTDHQKIVDVVRKHGGKAVLTSKKHRNGTERIYEVAKKIKVQSAEYYEKSIHKLLNKYRIGKEYFELELDKIKDCLQQVSILSEKGQKKVSLADLKKKIKIK